jgi:hypothetical protein
VLCPGPARRQIWRKDQLEKPEVGEGGPRYDVSEKLGDGESLVWVRICRNRPLVVAWVLVKYG